MKSAQTQVRLTQYSHGAGCGCKISPKILQDILPSSATGDFPNLLVGNSNRDDAAVYDLGNGDAIISTTDFFLPIVDDPFDFGQIAAANAISDIYAMGGEPILALAIFALPLDKLSPQVGKLILEGGKHICDKLKVALAGGHSIDAREPIFGLAVTGKVKIANLKRNDKARANSKLYLTKPLGIGILTSAEKEAKLEESHRRLATDLMLIPNDFGAKIAAFAGLSSMTDVTGFGLLGHLLEICQASNLHANIDWRLVPKIDAAIKYAKMGIAPGGTGRNFASYGQQISPLDELQKTILCDPQTSGGLLLVVDADKEAEFLQIAKSANLVLQSFGQLRRIRADDEYQICVK